LPGVRRGRVAAFGSVAGELGTERLVVVAETRVTDAAARGELVARIQEVVGGMIGEPADDVVLAAPNSVLKTSSGKLRRAACRAAYEQRQLGRPDAQRLLGVFVRGTLDRARRGTRSLRGLLFAGYAWGIVGLLTLPLLAVLLLPTQRLRWQGGRAVIETLRLATATRLTVHKTTALPVGPCIFIANHASYLDALILMRALPRPVAFVAKQELAAHRTTRWLLRRFGAVFVDRFDPLRCTAVVREAARARRDFLFFPEGTFQRMPGLLPFHLGAFAAAVEAGSPLVPIAIRGSRSMLRGDERFPRPGTLEVCFGSALQPDPVAERWSETLRLATHARAFLLDTTSEPDLTAAAGGFEVSATRVSAA
jgi:1-acyl-sn-glycerol-3-phosphate acyltransferase